jgi:hypothetical protein
VWQRSFSQCRGLFVLSEYHRRYLFERLKPSFPISVLYHPTEFPERGFELDRYLANPRKRVLQIGWWLRKLSSIDRVTAPGHTPTLLGASDWSKNLLSYAERRYHGLHAPGVADIIDFVDNNTYDELLSENVVFIDFYDTSANNAVIECVARGTPIVVCRHPAVEEYLGADYPLYYKDKSEVSRLLADSGRIRGAHDYLQRSELRIRLTLVNFQQSFAKSEVVRHAYS